MANNQAQDSSSHKKRINYLLFLSAFVLVLFGLLAIYDASVVLATSQFNDPFFFLKSQSVWVFLGLLAAVFLSQVDFHFWEKTSNLSFLVTLILLLAVLIPGLGEKVYGSRRRLNLPIFAPVVGTVGFQPAEFAKFTSIIFLATFLKKRQAEKNKENKERVVRGRKFTKKNSSFSQTFLPFVLIVGFTSTLIVLEPDLGTALILGTTAFLLYFFSGGGLTEVLTLAIGAIIVVTFFIFSSGYRQQRFLSFLNPQSDKLNASYQLNQVLIALGSGGVSGLGLGVSRQKYQYIPEVTTDSIFAVVGEELGFMGSLSLIGLIVFLIYQGFHLVGIVTDPFGRLLAFGIVATIAVQSFLNLGSMTGLVPLTGVPLPFISYGGSNVLVLLMSIGVLLNISKSS